VANAPNGGYLVATVVRALRDLVPHPDPFAVSAHFTLRTENGPADIEGGVVRVGRAHSTASGTLAQRDITRVHVTATFGDLAAMDGPTSVRQDVPDFPPPDECVPASGELAPAFIRNFDLRLTPATAAWATTRPSGVAEMAGWIRFADGRNPDPLSLPLFADAFPPTVFNLLEALWVPTIELTVHVRGRPVPGWLRCRFTTRYLIDGYLEEDGELWDAGGHLVALSRQLARVHR
jgi:acyl-CoA thioesterase